VSHAIPEGPERRAALSREAMARTGLDEAVIERMLRAFYAAARQDPLLAPAFAGVADWEAHIARIAAFWSSVALMTGRYHGNPLAAHLPLDVGAAHFDRWLALFEATARAECPPAGAALLIERARRIAESLRHGLDAHRGILPAAPARPSARRSPRMCTETLAAGRPAATGLADRLVAEIAASLPGATAVFRRHEIDFCCGGKVPLAEAAAAKGIPLDRVEADLAALDAPGAAPPVETGALIALILERYHAAHRRELPELLRLARRVEAVHGEHPAAPRGLPALLEEVAAELESHMQKEERVLFPALQRGGRHPNIGSPIAMMREEHDDHAAHLRQLESLTGNFVAPAGACPTWQALYAGLRKLADDLMEHIHLENNVLFPRFEA